MPLHLSTPLTALIAFVVMMILQALPPTPEVIDIEKGAGIYALLFLVFKELVSLVKWFRKDPVEAKVAVNNELINNLTVIVTKFISKVTEVEAERQSRVNEMKPAITDMQQNLAILVDRQRSRRKKKSSGKG